VTAARDTLHLVSTATQPQNVRRHASISAAIAVSSWHRQDAELVVVDRVTHDDAMNFTARATRGLRASGGETPTTGFGNRAKSGHSSAPTWRTDPPWRIDSPARLTTAQDSAWQEMASSMTAAQRPDSDAARRAFRAAQFVQPSR
jgi:hypothetical protein